MISYMADYNFKHSNEAIDKITKCIRSCQTEKQLDNTKRWVEDYYLRNCRKWKNLYTAEIHENILNMIDIQRKIIRNVND